MVDLLELFFLLAFEDYLHTMPCLSIHLPPFPYMFYSVTTWKLSSTQNPIIVKWVEKLLAILMDGWGKINLIWKVIEK